MSAIEYNELHIDGFVPVLTNEDLDAYAARSDRPDGIDPRDGFDEWELPQVLMFLSGAAELKSMTETHNASRFGYERLCYAYSDVADSIQY